LEIEEGIGQSLVFRLFQLLTNQRAIQYEMAAYFDTDPEYTMPDF